MVCLFYFQFFSEWILSGTYNNQYMVVDLKRVSLGKQIEDWSLTVVEQIPGLVLYSDQSQALRHGEEYFHNKKSSMIHPLGINWKVCNT